MENPSNLSNSKQLIHDLSGKPPTTNDKLSFNRLLVFSLIAVVLGIASGFTLTKIKLGPTNNNLPNQNKRVVGITNKKIFKDKAEGILKEGGIDGEGNYHLQRPGGESQNVYLISSTVDLSQFINKKVRVWGETFSGEKAGWFMDVGLVELL